MAEPDNQNQKSSIDLNELSSLINNSEGGTASKLDDAPTPLSAEQKLNSWMAGILLGVSMVLLIVALKLWDGTSNGAYSDVWEYAKLIGTTVIGGIVATYLKPSQN